MDGRIPLPSREEAIPPSLHLQYLGGHPEIPPHVRLYPADFQSIGEALPSQILLLLEGLQPMTTGFRLDLFLDYITFGVILN